MKKGILITILLLMVIVLTLSGLVACKKDVVPEETGFPEITFSGLTPLAFYTNQTITAEMLVEGVTAKDANGVSYTVSTYDTTAIKPEEGTYTIVLACRDSSNTLVRKSATEIWKANRTVTMEFPPIVEVERHEWSTSLKLVSVSLPQAAGNVQSGIFATAGTNLNQPTEEEAGEMLLNLRDNTDDTINGQKIMIAENWLLEEDAILTAGDMWYITCENLNNWFFLYNGRTKIKADETMVAVQGKPAGWSGVIIKSAEVIRYGDVDEENSNIYTLQIRVDYNGADMIVVAVFEVCEDDSAVPFVNYAENLRLQESVAEIYTPESVSALNNAIDACALATTRDAYKPLFDVAYEALVNLEKNFDNKALALLDELEETDYSTVSWDAFFEAVIAASEELADETIYNGLYQTAVEAKEALNPRLDTSSASALMDGLTQSDYTSESWLAFKNAVDAAVAENDNQDTFNSLYAEAETAKENLVEKPSFERDVVLKSIKLYGDDTVVTHAGITSSTLVSFVGEGNGELETSYNLLYNFLANAENPSLVTGFDNSFVKGDIWYLQMLSIAGGYVLGGGAEGTKIAGSINDGSMLNDTIPLNSEQKGSKNMLRISYVDFQNYGVLTDDGYVMTVYFTSSGLYLYMDLTFDIPEVQETSYTFENSTWGGTLSTNPAIKSSFLYKEVGEGNGDAETSIKAVAFYHYQQEAVEGVKTAVCLDSPVFAEGDVFYLQMESLPSGFSFVDEEGEPTDAMTMVGALGVVVYSGEELAAAPKNCAEITYDDLINRGILSEDGTMMVLKVRLVYSGLIADINLNFAVSL